MISAFLRWISYALGIVAVVAGLVVIATNHTGPALFVFAGSSLSCLVAMVASGLTGPVGDEPTP